MRRLVFRACLLPAFLTISPAIPAALLQSPASGKLPAADITEPVLIPSQAPSLAQKCKKKHREEVEVDTLINSSGAPVQYYFRTAHGDEADLIALRTVAADQFTPAKRGGTAIQVLRTVAVTMELCVEKYKESDGSKAERLSLASTPEQRIFRSDDQSSGEFVIENPIAAHGTPYKVGGGISPPKPLTTPEAHYSDQARKARLQGTSWIRLIVDQHGAPENPHVFKSLGMGLDDKAVDAVQRYRFRPAMKNGQVAVPLMITVEVNFRLY